jgi:hypothetical protein
MSSASQNVPSGNPVFYRFLLQKNSSPFYSVISCFYICSNGV